MSTSLVIVAPAVTSAPSKNSLTELRFTAVLKSSIVKFNVASRRTAALFNGEAAVTFGVIPVTGASANQSKSPLAVLNRNVVGLEVTLNTASLPSGAFMGTRLSLPQPPEDGALNEPNATTVWLD